jgi:HlyD family secretion protein
MKVSISTAPAQARQVKQRLANPEESLSYELGKAVQELPPLYTRLLAGGISLLVFGAIAWAAFSQIDEVAAANGELIPSAQVRPVRASNVGSIEKITVKEGAIVKKGDVLVELDPGLSDADVQRLEKSAKLIREDIARLEAENRGERKTGTAIQDQLLNARLGQFDTERASAIAEANRQVATAQEAQVRLERLQENLINAKTNLLNAKSIYGNAQERVRSLKTLVTDGASPRLDYIEAVSQATKARDQVTDAEDKVISTEKEIDAQRERLRQAQEAYQGAQSKATGLTSQRQSEILTQLTKRREELTDVSGKLQSARKQRERETIEAPFNGTVYSIKATKGPVQSGEELLSIVPEGEQLMLEVKVLNRDIGFVQKGMKAKVKLATFPYQEFGIVDGVVDQVSPNAIVEKDVGLVFPTRVRLSKSSIKMKRGDKVEEVVLTPGMSASAEIVTRQKSILTFLIEPVTRRFYEAFSVR